MVCLYIPSSFSQNNDYGFGEEDKIYTKISDISLTTKRGNYKLSELNGQSPIIIALIFTRCTGICSPFLANLDENLRTLHSKKNYKVLVVSFDSRDNLEDMNALSNRMLLDKNDNWIFATTAQIETLTSSVGFVPIWDSVSNQFEHDALLVGVNEEGYIKKRLLGIRDAASITTMMNEINNEFVPSYPLPKKNQLLTCFTYDPVTGKRKISFGLLILLVPVLITALLLVWFSTKKQIIDS